MEINRVIIPKDVTQKIKIKHNIDEWEPKEVFFNDKDPLLVRRSQGKYIAYGRTYAGRYLLVAFKYLKGKIAEVRTARNMTDKEKNRYNKK